MSDEQQEITVIKAPIYLKYNFTAKGLNLPTAILLTLTGRLPTKKNLVKNPIHKINS